MNFRPFDVNYHLMHRLFELEFYQHGICNNEQIVEVDIQNISFLNILNAQIVEVDIQNIKLDIFYNWSTM